MCKWVKSRFIQLPGIQRVVAPVPGEQARQCIRPYRVHHFLNYGLVVRFRLLPTPPLGDAVSFSYGQPVFCPMGTSTPLLVRTLRRTSIRVPRVFRFEQSGIGVSTGIHAGRVCSRFLPAIFCVGFFGGNSTLAPSGAKLAGKAPGRRTVYQLVRMTRTEQDLMPGPHPYLTKILTGGPVQSEIYPIFAIAESNR